MTFSDCKVSLYLFTASLAEPSLRRSGFSPKERNHGKHQEENEQYLGNPRGGTSNTGKSQEGGDDSDNQKYQGVMQHDGVPHEARDIAPVSMCHISCHLSVKAVQKALYLTVTFIVPIARRQAETRELRL